MFVKILLLRWFERSNDFVLRKFVRYWKDGWSMLWIFTAEGSFIKGWIKIEMNIVSGKFGWQLLFSESVVCGLVVLFLIRGTIINKFCQKLGLDKIYKLTCLAALFETIEAVKLTFYNGLQNGFDVNWLTLGMRLYSHDRLIIRIFTVDKKLWYNYVTFDVPRKQNLIFAL